MNPEKRMDTFFDLIVKLSKGRFAIDLHIKDTNRHQYLHFDSSYQDHTKKLIIYVLNVKID